MDSLKFVDHLLLKSKEICEEIAHYKDAVFDSLAYHLTFKGSKVNGFSSVLLKLKSMFRHI